MTLRFLAIDPDTNGENCPALFLEEETGDLLFQGWTVTDPVVLAESGTHSPLAETESLVRLPARMRAIILEALMGTVPPFSELIAATTRTAAHLETRDAYTPDDPAFLDWRAGRPAAAPAGAAWYDLVREHTARGV